MEEVTFVFSRAGMSLAVFIALSALLWAAAGWAGPVFQQASSATQATAEET